MQPNTITYGAMAEWLRRWIPNPGSITRREYQHISRCFARFGTVCTIQNVKNIHGRVLLSVKSQAFAYNFTKSNNPPWVLFTFFKLYKWYQIT